MKAKNLCCLLLGLLLIGNASADWTYLSNSANKQNYFYVDADTIKSGAYSRGWILLDMVKPSNGMLSAKMLYEAECSTGRMRVLSMQTFTGKMGNGQLSNSFNNPAEWSYVAPGSVEEVIFVVFCGKRP